MTVGTSAPLLAIRHDWSVPVELESHVPCTVLPRDDGSEQRLALSHLATEHVTYRLLPPTNREAAALLALDGTDAWVRVPRWEDESRVSTAVTSGSGVSIPCDTTNKPTFAVGREIILWRSALEYEVTTADAVTSSTITADLADDWAAGTIIAPVMPGRMVFPISRAHWVPTSGALTFVVAFDLTDIAGVGTGGAGTTGVATAITVYPTSVGKFARAGILAIVTDAAGNILPGDGIVWSSADAVNAPVYSSSDPAIGIVSNPNGIDGTVSITATLGALSAAASARLLG